MRGEVEISMELLPMALAEKRAAGQGQSTPNMHPTLPPPERLKFSLFDPFGALKQMLGPQLFRKMVVLLCCAALCVVLFPMVFANVLSAKIDALTGWRDSGEADA